LIDEDESELEMFLGKNLDGMAVLRSLAKMAIEEIFGVSDN
jgi:hypothetical protein